LPLIKKHGCQQLPTKEDIIKAKKEFERFCKKVEVFELPSDKSKFAWYKLVIKSFFSKDGYTINWTKSKTMVKVNSAKTH